MQILYISYANILITTSNFLHNWMWSLKKKKQLGGNNRLSSNIPKWGSKLALDLIFTS